MWSTLYQDIIKQSTFIRTLPYCSPIATWRTASVTRRQQNGGSVFGGVHAGQPLNYVDTATLWRDDLHKDISLLGACVLHDV